MSLIISQKESGKSKSPSGRASWVGWFTVGAVGGSASARIFPTVEKNLLIYEIYNKMIRLFGRVWPTQPRF